MTTAIAKLEQDPVHYELAEWFVKSGEDVRTPDDILEKIYKIRDGWGIKSDVVNKEYRSYINDCRIYLEEKYKLTLWPVRLPDHRYCGYKIASDSEATTIVVKTGKQVMMANERFLRRLPMAKPEYIWPSVKKVFGDTKEAAKRYKVLSDRYLLAYDTDLSKIKKQEKENRAEELTDGKRKLVNNS